MTTRRDSADTSYCLRWYVYSRACGLHYFGLFPVLRDISMDTSERSFLVSCLGELCAVIGFYPISCFLHVAVSFVFLQQLSELSLSLSAGRNCLWAEDAVHLHCRRESQITPRVFVFCILSFKKRIFFIYWPIVMTYRGERPIKACLVLSLEHHFFYFSPPEYKTQDGIIQKSIFPILNSPF